MHTPEAFAEAFAGHSYIIREFGHRCMGKCSGHASRSYDTHGKNAVLMQEMMPRWHDDLVDHFGVGLDPEARM